MKFNLVTVAILSVLMLMTRGSHFSGFDALPEASWMISWSLAQYSLLGHSLGLCL
jgi:hypothetical protein